MNESGVVRELINGKEEVTKAVVKSRVGLLFIKGDDDKREKDCLICAARDSTAMENELL